MRVDIRPRTIGRHDLDLLHTTLRVRYSR
jgi:hypothetical protein